MKANQAPKKLYYAPYGDIREDYPITDNDIEYTQTDAFIEKAVNYIAENMKCDGYTFQTKAKFIRDFKNYIKGE